MMRSLFSGVSGLRNHQTRMDVIGNNIANVNTVGFKQSRTIFQDLFSQTLMPASSPQGTTVGGTNPSQVGLGMTLASIDVMFSRGSAQFTGAPLDVMIEGDGYFVIKDATGNICYTRAGDFMVDKNDNLLTSSGMFVMGVMGDSGTLSANSTITNLEALTIDFDKYESVSIDKNGFIVGKEKGTGTPAVIGKLAIATFPNVAGLEKIGGNLYAQTTNTGDPTFSFAGGGGYASAGLINPGSLEMSNVDLSEQFTDMIITQRGFQANARTITVSDTLLEELVNLKR